MDDEEGGLFLGRMASLGGLPVGLGEANDNVAEVGGVVGWCGEGGVGFWLEGLGVVVALPGAVVS